MSKLIGTGRAIVVRAAGTTASTAPLAAPACFPDTFNRFVPEGVNAGWGTGPLGTWTGTGGVQQSGVEGGGAYCEVPAAGSFAVQACLLTRRPWSPPFEVTYTVIIPNPGVPHPGAGGQSGWESFWINAVTGNAFFDVSLTAATSSLGVLTGWSAELEVFDDNFNILGDAATALDSGLLGQLLRLRYRQENAASYIRVWADGTTEPTSWTVSLPYTTWTWSGLMPGGTDFGCHLESGTQRTIMSLVDPCN